MIVPVAVVLDVAMPVVDVVHVAVVRYGDVPAAHLCSWLWLSCVV